MNLLVWRFDLSCGKRLVCHWWDVVDVLEELEVGRVTLRRPGTGVGPPTTEGRG